jgi:hypothetical protein
MGTKRWGGGQLNFSPYILLWLWGEPAGFCGKSLSSKVLLNLKNCFLKLHQRCYQVKNYEIMRFQSLCDFIGF